MSERFYKDVIAAGFGGQGVMVLGQLIAYSGIAEGRHVTWIPSYGPEMRGGTANCTVVVSEDEIGSPVANKADIVVVMNQPSLTKFESAVNKGGYLFYNSDLIKYDNPRKDITVIPVPAQSIAFEAGSDKVSNIVILGAIVEATGIVSKEVCKDTIKEKLGKRKPEFLPMNIEVFEKGMEVARKVLGK